MAGIKQLRLSTPEASRKTYARILRAFNIGELDEGKFRALVYGLSHYLEYWKFEKDLQIESRLKAIEEKLGAAK